MKKTLINGLPTSQRLHRKRSNNHAPVRVLPAQWHIGLSHFHHHAGGAGKVIANAHQGTRRAHFQKSTPGELGILQQCMLSVEWYALLFQSLHFAGQMIGIVYISYVYITVYGYKYLYKFRDSVATSIFTTHPEALAFSDRVFCIPVVYMEHYYGHPTTLQGGSGTFHQRIWLGKIIFCTADLQKVNLLCKAEQIKQNEYMYKCINI